MPHQNLNAAPIDRLLQQVGREAVAQDMGRYQFGQVGGSTRLVADAPDRCLCDGVLGIVSAGDLACADGNVIQIRGGFD